MKTLNKLCSLIFLLSFSAQAGLPPTTMKGQSDTSPSVTFNLQAPKKQATRVNATTALIETGNENLVADPGIESNSTTNYSLGTATLTNGIPTGTPTFGSGASGNLSIAASNTTPIAGAYSLNYVSSAATTAGNFVATAALTVDPENRAKVMQFKVKYNVSSGSSNVNLSGTSSNSYGVAVYDVTNSAWLPCAGQFNILQTGVGEARGTCQTGITTASVRMVVYNASATAGAATLQLDSFYLGPQITSQGAAITDWQSYTPTISGCGSATVTFAEWRQVGEATEIRGKAVCTTVGGTALKVSLPSGQTGRAATDILLTGNLGTAYNGADSKSFPIMISGDNTNVQFSKNDTTTLFSPATSGNLMNSGDYFAFTAIVPIVGRSSNTVMSADTDTRVVIAQAQGTPATASAANPVIFPTIVWDTHGAYSTSTGRFTAPVSGYYNVKTVINGSNNVSYYIYVAGVQTRWLGNASAGPGLIWSSGTVKANAGDQIDVRPDGSGSGSMGGSGSITFERVTGPATVAASDSVNAEYSGSTTVLGSSPTTVLFPTKGYDSHNAYNTATGVYTCPVSGKYRLTVYLSTNNTSGTAITSTRVVQTGSVSATRVFARQAKASSNLMSKSWSGSITRPCVAGDTLTIQGADGDANTLDAESFFTIERVGN